METLGIIAFTVAALSGMIVIPLSLFLLCRPKRVSKPTRMSDIAGLPQMAAMREAKDLDGITNVMLSPISGGEAVPTWAQDFIKKTMIAVKGAGLETVTTKVIKGTFANMGKNGEKDLNVGSVFNAFKKSLDDKTSAVPPVQNSEQSGDDYLPLPTEIIVAAPPIATMSAASKPVAPATKAAAAAAASPATKGGAKPKPMSKNAAGAKPMSKGGAKKAPAMPDMGNMMNQLMNGGGMPPEMEGMMKNVPPEMQGMMQNMMSMFGSMKKGAGPQKGSAKGPAKGRGKVPPGTPSPEALLKMAEETKKMLGADESDPNGKILMEQADNILASSRLHVKGGDADGKFFGDVSKILKTAQVAADQEDGEEGTAEAEAALRGLELANEKLAKLEGEEIITEAASAAVPKVSKAARKREKREQQEAAAVPVKPTVTAILAGTVTEDEQIFDMSKSTLPSAADSPFTAAEGDNISHKMISALQDE